MAKPLTIIMVAKNHLEQTQKALESLAKYTDPSKYKLLFMDNGEALVDDNGMRGVDGSDAWVIDFCLTHGIELKYQVNGGNVGWVKAINKAYDMCDTPFSLTCHNDIVFCDQWLDNMMRRFRNDKVAAVGPVISFAMGPQASRYAFLTFGVEVNYLLGLFFLCRMEVLREVKAKYNNNIDYLPAAYGLGDKEELELCYRIRQLGYTLEIARDVYIVHEGEKSFVDTLGSQQAFYDYQKKQEAVLIDRLGIDVVRDIFAVNITKPIKLFVGILTRTEYVHYLNVISLLKIWGFTQVEKSFYHVAKGHPAHARNRIVKEFLKTDYTHLLFIDDDMLFEQDVVNKLLAHDVDICSGVAYQRGIPHAPCTFLCNGETKSFYPVQVSGKGFVQVDAIGGYFILAKRKVLETVQSPWFVFGDTSLGYNDSGDPDDKGIGEDVYFCAKSKEAGFEIWADGSIEIKHIGIATIIDSEYVTKYEASGDLKKDLDMIDTFRKM